MCQVRKPTGFGGALGARLPELLQRALRAAQEPRGRGNGMEQGAKEKRKQEKEKGACMNNGLLPCPFCGSNCQTVKHSGRWGWFVSCECAAVGPSGTSKQDAIELWNGRKNDERQIPALFRELVAYDPNA